MNAFVQMILEHLWTLKIVNCLVQETVRLNVAESLEVMFTSREIQVLLIHSKLEIFFIRARVEGFF